MRTVVRSLASRRPEGRGGRAMGSSPHVTAPSGAEAILRGGVAGRGPSPSVRAAGKANLLIVFLFVLGDGWGGLPLRLATSRHKRMRSYTTEPLPSQPGTCTKASSSRGLSAKALCDHDVHKEWLCISAVFRPPHWPALRRSLEAHRSMRSPAPEQRAESGNTGS